MEIVGRITANATSKVVSDERTVVNFSIAINDSYKPKGATEVKKVTTFIDCSYWLNAGVVEYLTKGTIVLLSGSISARAWKSSDDDVKAGLNFHVNSIKLLGGGKKDEAITEPPTENVAPVDDLPF